MLCRPTDRLCCWYVRPLDLLKRYDDNAWDNQRGFRFVRCSTPRSMHMASAGRIRRRPKSNVRQAGQTTGKATAQPYPVTSIHRHLTRPRRRRPGSLSPPYRRSGSTSSSSTCMLRRRWRAADLGKHTATTTHDSPTAGPDASAHLPTC
jgi:hypothetical protein